MRRMLFVSFLSALTIFSLAGASSCSNPKPLVSDVTFKFNPELTSARLQLNFASDVQTDLGGTFAVNAGGREYGSLFVEPSTGSTPFNVGFDLNLDILNDQDFAQIDPVDDLPSGQKLPTIIGRKMARVKMKNEINQNFDIYTYVDVLGKEWLGVAMTLKFIDNKYFPAGLSVTQNFLKDPSGNPQASASVFGPKVDANGSLAAYGGIALFANVVSLAKNAPKTNMGGEVATLPLEFNGPAAAYFSAHPEEAYKLGEVFKELMRANTQKNDARKGH